MTESDQFSQLQDCVYPCYEGSLECYYIYFYNFKKTIDYTITMVYNKGINKGESKNVEIGIKRIKTSFSTK